MIWVTVSPFCCPFPLVAGTLETASGTEDDVGPGSIGGGGTSGPGNVVEGGTVEELDPDGGSVEEVLSEPLVELPGGGTAS